ncbi:DUF2061 domain-containing protein [Natrarchaeobaculum aegyptiacum]|uniref:DUF2061 domain-containing protein n=1 Tax=Natrarchaeobaculum aegyptiacum TaxID=745377 RepID=A0A2Z2HXU7_9EURY|nr:DUF2061 domain-containing protein [Natrarchaeobaculum aegyptiacum]ARS89814.1 hypothetical protein B1756_08715 [Natrarchaeobaculum aegyptiacum]
MKLARLFTWSPHQGQLRAIVKTLCYRLFMIMITVGVAWIITGSGTDAVSIGIVTNVTKTFTYYLYERMWDHITWGIDPNPN